MSLYSWTSKDALERDVEAFGRENKAFAGTGASVSCHIDRDTANKRYTHEVWYPNVRLCLVRLNSMVRLEKLGVVVAAFVAMFGKEHVQVKTPEGDNCGYVRTEGMFFEKKIENEGYWTLKS